MLGSGVSDFKILGSVVLKFQAVFLVDWRSVHLQISKLPTEYYHCSSRFLGWTRWF